MAKSSKTSQSLSPAQQAGLLGEALVAAWWQQQGWTVIAQRWHCRWGELDLVVRSPPPPSAPQNPPRIPQPQTLAFVEVKTRAKKNWDQDGLLALTPKKQTKLIRTAQTFLGEFPNLTDDACRFDVAAVRCDRPPTSSPPNSTPPDPIPVNLDLSNLDRHNLNVSQIQNLTIGHPVTLSRHRLTLQHYIPNAFDLSE